MQNVWGEKMKEVLESLQAIDVKIDDCRYYLTTIIDCEEKDILFGALNEMSKEVKTLINEIN